jgi:hypothetical protein
VWDALLVKRMEDAIDLGRLRAPREDGGILVEPDVDSLDVSSISADGELQVSPAATSDCLRNLAQDARREILDAALRYTRSYRDVTVPNLESPLFVGGHQPELFHPGVWAKNFALADLAERFEGVAINLVIDSDVVKSTTVAVPEFDGKVARFRRIPFDAVLESVPHEIRDAADAATFRRFGDAVREAIGPMVNEPVISSLWPLAVERGAATRNLGLRLAQSRHQLEGKWGVNTLELPQSQVGSTRSFSRFALHLFKHAGEFRSVHNAALRNYRQRYRLRGRSHPVPELEARDGWIEVPFWAYSKQAPRRTRLFAKWLGDRVALTDFGSFSVELPDCSRCDDAAVDALLTVGLTTAIRSRALATTLFARLFLADVFVHGIGGAKYDRLTDEIIRRYFGVRPQPYMVVTATLRLPIPHDSADAADLTRSQERLRELTFHPEVYLDGNQTAAESQWVKNKWEWIRTQPTPSTSRRRCQEIRHANEMLQPSMAAVRERVLEERAEIESLLEVDRVLGSREFAFCLFPAEKLHAMRNSIREAIVPS